jgi:hypothetical protein
MTKITRLSGMSFAVVGILLAVACSRESNQKQPVTTTTEKGASTAAPASEAEKRDHALVRVVHAMPKGPTLDVFADDQKAFDDVSYKQVTPYKELPDKLAVTFTVRLAGQDGGEPLAEKSEIISSGNHYTIVALPDTKAQLLLKVINDDLEPPSADKAKVRFIHVSPEAGEVDVYSRERKKALFDGVNFESEAGYCEVDPMKTTLEVRPEGKKNVLLTIPNAALDAGKIYTILIAGKTKDAPKLEAITIEDQFGIPTAHLNSPRLSKKPTAN